MTLTIKWNRRALGQVLRSAAVQAELTRRAQNIATVCGNGYIAVSEKGRTRARAAVVTGTIDAMLDNATNNSLIRNLDRGRD